MQSILAFYDPVCRDPNGGFYHFFRDDGSVYDATTRHLVSSARFVFNYAEAATFFEKPAYLEYARHGLDYLDTAHRRPDGGGYIWLIEDGTVADGTNHAYGLAFVLLAYATALRAGIDEARASIESTFSLMEKYFWDDQFELYRDEYSADFSELSPYRGQNANMHACEALISAYQATSDGVYLNRALRVADNICRRQADQGDGIIWEHYDEKWHIDWDYNRDNPKHLFRPWGFQTGHQTEWTKLLLTLDEYVDEDWLKTTAKKLFDKAVATGWDEEFGGLCYGFDTNDEICDDDKYFWVQAESFAAAARLGIATGDDQYFEWYNKIWQYSFEHFVDHKFGAWYRILRRNNERYDDLKSPAGKTDYHTFGACLDVVRGLRRGATASNDR